MSDKEDPKKVSAVIPAGKQQETGFTRFIRTNDDEPDVIKDAKINNIDATDEKGNIAADESVNNKSINTDKKSSANKNKYDQSANPDKDLLDDQEK